MKSRRKARPVSAYDAIGLGGNMEQVQQRCEQRVAQSAGGRRFTTAGWDGRTTLGHYV
jgi:hypothetical protein